jgi:hypothetical protein
MLPPPPPPAPKATLPEQEWEKKSLVSTHPNAVGKDGRTISDRLELLKECAGETFRAGDLKMSATMYTEAIKLGPSHTLYSNRSAVYCAAGEYIKALEDACKSIELMPTWFKVSKRRPGSTEQSRLRTRQAYCPSEARTCGLTSTAWSRARCAGLCSQRCCTPWHGSLD